MAEYWFIDNQLPETPDLPAGYETGLIDEDNPAPKGAEILNNEKELTARTLKAEEVIASDLSDIKSDVQLLEQAEYAKKYPVAEIREYAIELGLPTKDGGENIKRADLVAAIYKAVQ